MKVGPGKWLGVRTLVEQAGGFEFTSPVPIKKLSMAMQPGTSLEPSSCLGAEMGGSLGLA